MRTAPPAPPSSANTAVVRSGEGEREVMSSRTAVIPATKRGPRGSMPAAWCEGDLLRVMLGEDFCSEDHG